jgi:hypothetical protein
MIGMPNRGSMHAIVAGRIGMTLQPCNIAFSYQLPSPLVDGCRPYPLPQCECEFRPFASVTTCVTPHVAVTR